MADEKVDIIFAHPCDGHAPGERVSVTADEAVTYVGAAMASYATKTAAKTATETVHAAK